MQRVRIRIKGVVQGVGFRPFVYNLAEKYGLRGFCLNDAEGVLIDVEGANVDYFIGELKSRHPPLARIESLSIERLKPAMYSGFSIAESQSQTRRLPVVPPDVATCRDCLRELFTREDRRYLYPFINCTNCGPRYSIIEEVPYDRCQTTMRTFRMCKECLAEYHNPSDRRFHAQPNACWQCGPQVWLSDRDGNRVCEGQEAIDRVRELLKEGAIVAVKGLGGFHLACDAENNETVRLLRDRKCRPLKPFAVMSPDVKAVKGYARVSPEEERLLKSAESPIVLLRRLPWCPLSELVAPETELLGVMLAYTPLHHLVTKGFTALVMTSGNMADEPIELNNEDALERLSHIADYFLLHNRPIHTRVDDSIVRHTRRGATMLRRARGYTPHVVRIAKDSPQLLALGGEKKQSITLVTSGYAIMSQHIGELSTLKTLEFLEETVEKLKRLFDIKPAVVVHDMHPDYLTTAFAKEYAKKHSIEDRMVIAVQHHHAHIASVMAEWGLKGELVGVSFDGTGYGTDGTVWGGEFLVATEKDFTREAHLVYIPMPGGEKATQEPWRMATAYLHAIYGDRMDDYPSDFLNRVGEGKVAAMLKLIENRINTPLTSSAGRLFDAVASLAGLKDRITFEGEAAVRLTELAEREGDRSGYPFEIRENGTMEVDTLPAVEAAVEEVKKGVPVTVVARRFHNTLVHMMVEVVDILCERTGIDRVALSGGVFQNRLLLEGVAERLEKMGLRVYHNQRFPVNDGGLSLGQALIGLERSQRD